MDWKATWKYNCYECNRPLCIYFILGPNIDKIDFMNSLFTYKKFNPILSSGQIFFYKFYGLKVKRVCYCCFKGLFRPKFNQIMNREIGKRMMYCKKTDELTVYHEWLKGFDRFFRRKDKHEYMIEKM